MGKSLPKQGQTLKVPVELTSGIATHATMHQLTGEGEASRRSMVVTAQALIHKTPWEGKLNAEFVWRATRLCHPEIIHPVQDKDNEDHRAEWMKYGTLNDWFDGAKRGLSKLGMMKDEPRLMCG